MDYYLLGFALLIQLPLAALGWLVGTQPEVTKPYEVQLTICFSILLVVNFCLTFIQGIRNINSQNQLQNVVEDTRDSVTGGDTYPKIMAAIITPEPDTGFPLTLIAVGKHNLIDVSISVRDVTSGGLAYFLAPGQSCHLSTVLGNMATQLPIVIKPNETNTYYIEIMARNGYFKETLSFKRDSSQSWPYIQEYQVFDISGKLLEKFPRDCPVYIERHAKKHKKSWFEDQRRIKQRFIPTFGTMRLDSITRSDIAKFHGAVGKKHLYSANRMLELLSKMFQLAILWGYLPDNHVNPAKGIQAFKEEKRDRWVKPTELPALAKAINNEKNLYGKNALWLYLLLGVRRDELLRAKWEDVDWERKELRIPETKVGRVHYVPLSAPALSILHESPKQKANPYILPGEKPGHHLVNIEKIWRRVRKAAGIEDVR